MKKFFSIILIIAVAVGASALVGHLTNGFQEPAKNIFLNEDNLVRQIEEYTSKAGNSGNGLTWTVDESTKSISVSGKLASTAEDAVFTLGTVTVEEEGFYTLTGCKNGSESTYYLIATYDDATGNEKTLYANFADSMTTEAELPIGTTIELSIVIKAGQELNGVKFTPTLVLGEEPGRF